MGRWFRVQKGVSMEWKYVKEIKSAELISDFERKFNFKFPDEYRECVLKYNGGRPSKKVFDTEKVKEREIKSLLSFNHNDLETMWFVNDCNDTSLYIAFATDSAGNLICFNASDSSIVFIEHETNVIEKVSDNFVNFIGSLYSL